MCLVLKDQKRKKPSVAKEDITVAKVGYTDDGGQTFRPIYMTFFPYRKGETCKQVKMKIEVQNVPELTKDGNMVMWWEKNVVRIGYHAYMDFNSCLKMMGDIPISWSMEYPFRDFCIGEFTIPAGAKYFTGNNGDIVSSEIRFERTLGVFGEETDKTRERMESNKRLQ